MQPLLIVFYALRFALELLMLFAFAYWAWKLELLPQVRVLIGSAAVLAVAATWGLFVAPKARVRLNENARLTIELCIIAASVAALRATGRVREALLLAAAAVVVAIVNSVLRRSGAATMLQPQ